MASNYLVWDVTKA